MYEVCRIDDFENIHNEVKGITNTLKKVKNKEKCKKIKKFLPKIKQNYGGAYYSVYMRSSELIRIEELGFFGPFDERIKEGKYDVFIDIFSPIGTQTIPECVGSRRILHQNNQFVEASSGQIFYVPLSINIKPTIWHLIQFRLEGPDTIRGQKMLRENIVECEESRVKFDFMSGSGQLPRIKFTLLNKLDKVEVDENLEFDGKRKSESLKGKGYENFFHQILNYFCKKTNHSHNWNDDDIESF